MGSLLRVLFKRAHVGGALLLLCASAARSQTPTVDGNREIPDFRIQVWAETVEDFGARVSRYAELRRKLEQGLTGLTITDDPAEIERAESALAGRIRAARGRARQGEFFTPTITREFTRALKVEMNPITWAAIMDDNPGEFAQTINGTYPKERTLSTVPPNILAALPTLPDDIQYRFVGRHLILLDTRANIIIDRIREAIKCERCDDDPE